LALFQLRGIDQQIDAALGDIEPDHVAVLHQRQRTADGGFRRDMQHDGAKCSPAHSCIRYPHHVLDASARQLLRDRQIACFRHARRPLGAGIAQHQYVVGVDVEIGIVDAQRHVFD
jgi:hypothetical protein